MKLISYKNAGGLFTSLFILGVVVITVANFTRHLPIHGILLPVGIALIGLGLLIYMGFWRCPACRQLLPRQMPHSCKSCGHRLKDEGGS